ncbi:hypothetical protein ABIE44_000974 [Marmoricola sp. OAE513]
MWEEGRWSGSRVTRFSIFACVLLVIADLVPGGGLDRIFDVGFVVLCIAIALAIRPSEFFTVGVLPPMLLLGLCSVLAVLHRSWIAASDDGLIQAVISGLAHHSGALLGGYVLCLGVLAIRSRVLRRADGAHSKRDASPAPYRMTSAAPEVRSTTVVGNEPHSPESMTTSST